MGIFLLIFLSVVILFTSSIDSTQQKSKWSSIVLNDPCGHQTFITTEGYFTKRNNEVFKNNRASPHYEFSNIYLNSSYNYQEDLTIKNQCQCCYWKAEKTFNLYQAKISKAIQSTSSSTSLCTLTTSSLSMIPKTVPSLIFSNISKDQKGIKDKIINDSHRIKEDFSSIMNKFFHLHLINKKRIQRSKDQKKPLLFNDSNRTSFQKHYHLRNNNSTFILRNDSVIKDSNGLVYYFINGFRRPILSSRILYLWNLNWNRTIQVPKRIMENIALGPPLEDKSPPHISSLVDGLIAIDGRKTGLDFSHPIAQGTEFTFSGWFWIWRFTNDISEDIHLFHSTPRKDGHLSPRIAIEQAQNVSNRRLYFSVTTSNGIMTKGTITERTWFHVMITLKGNTFSIYINGKYDISLIVVKDIIDIPYYPQENILTIGGNKEYKSFVGLLYKLQMHSGVAQTNVAQIEALLASTAPVNIPRRICDQADTLWVPKNTTFPPDSMKYPEHSQRSIFKIKRMFEIGSRFARGHGANVSCPSLEKIVRLNDSTPYIPPENEETVPCGPSTDLAHIYFLLGIVSASDIMEPQMELIRPYMTLGYTHIRGSNTGSKYTYHTSEFHENMAGQQTRNAIAANSNCFIAASYYLRAAKYADATFDRHELNNYHLYDQETRLEREFEEKLAENDGFLQFQIHLADHGDSDAQVYLGKQYLWGYRGLTRDFSKAATYFRRATAQGHPAGHYNLAMMMHKINHNISQISINPLHLFQYAARKGYSEALNQMGEFCLKGSHPEVVVNHTKAFEMFQAATLKGNLDAHYNLGIMYRDGIGTDKCLRKALRYLGLAASHKHFHSLLELGEALLAPNSWISKYGNRLSNEKKKGIEALTLRIRIGDTSRKLSFPLRQRCSAAIKYLREAAQLGPWSNVLRTSLRKYSTGDIKNSLVLYEEAAEMGYPVAQANAAFIWEHHGPTRKDQATVYFAKRRAYHWHEILAGEGHIESIRKIGNYYYYGDGVEKNATKAYEMYLIGSGKNDSQSIFDLAIMHLHKNEGISRNVPYSMQLLHRCIELGGSGQWPAYLALLMIKVVPITVIEKIMQNMQELSFTWIIEEIRYIVMAMVETQWSYMNFMYQYISNWIKEDLE